jgi:hypothetical protein
MNNWIPVNVQPPIDPEYNYADEWRSVEVIFTDGKGQWIGYQQVELEMGADYWIMKGPDGYDVENVTHWKMLDSFP